MTIWAALRSAVLGWRAILVGDADWRGHFRLNPSGLATALVLFYAFAALVLVLASLQIGVPTLAGFLDVMATQSLWLLALLLATLITRQVLAASAPLLDLLVPGIYALIAYLVAGTIVMLIVAALLPLLWLGLAAMLFRLARVAAGWSVGVSLAFALLTIVLLVGLPMTLYMLTSPPA